MHPLIHTVLLAASIILASGSSFADGREPLSLSMSQPMSFGEFVSNNGGRLRLNPDGSIERTFGNVQPLEGHQPGIMYLTGEPNEEATITFENMVSLTHAAGDQLLVRLFRTGPGSLGQLFTTGSLHLISLDTNGEGEFTVGASLYINDNQREGDYTGQVSITVSYD